MYDSYFLYIILISFLAIIKFDFNFDGWRHVYFIYPFIIILSLSGIYFLNIFIKKKYFKIAIFSIIFLDQVPVNPPISTTRLFSSKSCL